MLIDLVIDLGSESLRIYKNGEGMIFDEPSLALVGGDPGAPVITDVGQSANDRALEAAGGGQYGLVRPIKNAGITDVKTAKLFFAECFKRSGVEPSFFDKIRVVALVGCGLGYAERRLAADAIKGAGARRVYVVDGLLALYCYSEVDRGFFVDIGAAAANAGFVAHDGIKTGFQTDVAGNAVNAALRALIESRYGLTIGARSAEKIKRASTVYGVPDGAIRVNGKDAQGNFVSADVYFSDVAACARGVFDELIGLLDAAIFGLPVRDRNLVCGSGIFLSGGSAMFAGLPEYLAEKLRLKVSVVANCREAAVIGAARFYRERGLLKELIKI
ncbi:MAG: rod shape-determining protein [Clostridiales bacterium]|jgi:rod shape-determining protein MreB|nr:rod shape-determining protein [Clostridiales bacterium]